MGYWIKGDGETTIKPSISGTAGNKHNLNTNEKGKVKMTY